jgi:hypothetical protein
MGKIFNTAARRLDSKCEQGSSKQPFVAISGDYDPSVSDVLLRRKRRTFAHDWSQVGERSSDVVARLASLEFRQGT